jgi:hypothetical protein
MDLSTDGGSSMSTEQFYANLPICNRFLDLTDAANFAPAPSNWYVAVTDVVNSTTAIDAGRYRDVNIVGAMAIIAVLNATHQQDLPFVFGGDGASLLIPPSMWQATQQALVSSRRLAQEAFGLTLRVGIVPISDIFSDGYLLKVAKYRVAETYCQAGFMGGGLTYATELLKRSDAYHLEAQPDTPLPNLSGLECRWQDIRSPSGHILTLIVMANTQVHSSNSVYAQVLHHVSHIYGDAEVYRPVTPPQLKLSLNPRRLRTEAIFRSHGMTWTARVGYWMRLYAETMLGALLMRSRLRLDGVDWAQYRDSVVLATDFQKIEDKLHMIISGSDRQAQALMHELNRMAANGQLRYGSHHSNRVQMTCMILNRQNSHIHFIDGADGGYAKAAKQLKQQCDRAGQPWDIPTTVP